MSPTAGSATLNVFLSNLVLPIVFGACHDVPAEISDFCISLQTQIEHRNQAHSGVHGTQWSVACANMSLPHEGQVVAEKVCWFAGMRCLSTNVKHIFRYDTEND
jgi:hypothetical protein